MRSQDRELHQFLQLQTDPDGVAVAFRRFALSAVTKQISSKLFGDPLLLERIAKEVSNLMRREFCHRKGWAQFVVETIA